MAPFWQGFYVFHQYLLGDFVCRGDKIVPCPQLRTFAGQKFLPEDGAGAALDEPHHIGWPQSGRRVYQHPAVVLPALQVYQLDVVLFADLGGEGDEAVLEPIYQEYLSAIARTEHEVIVHRGDSGAAVGVHVSKIA